MQEKNYLRVLRNEFTNPSCILKLPWFYITYRYAENTLKRSYANLFPQRSSPL